MQTSHSTRSSWHRLFGALVLTASAGVALAADPAIHPVVKRKVNFPPPAELRYAINAKQSGLDVTGEALVRWSKSGGTYSLHTETRAMLVGKILETSSEGAIDSFGLAPAHFTEKRFRRDPITATFDRERNRLHFSQSSASYALKGGEQDRTSIVWQLAAVARGNPAKFVKGSAWLFFVAGTRDAEQWRFTVVGRETIKTKQGDVTAVHLFRTPPPDDQGQKLDIWLAPSAEWYPVRLRFTDPDGDFIEQTLDSFTKLKR